MYPIRTIDGVETPAPGRWTIPNQHFAAPSAEQGNTSLAACSSSATSSPTRG